MLHCCIVLVTMKHKHVPSITICFSVIVNLCVLRTYCVHKDCGFCILYFVHNFVDSHYCDISDF
jgi:hypothetical protein